MSFPAVDQLTLIILYSWLWSLYHQLELFERRVVSRLSVTPIILFMVVFYNFILLILQNGKLIFMQRLCSFDKAFEDLIYPKGEPDAVSVSKRDIDLLLPDTFVNDTIIDFYIKQVLCGITLWLVVFLHCRSMLYQHNNKNTPYYYYLCIVRRWDRQKDAVRGRRHRYYIQLFSG